MSGFGSAATSDPRGLDLNSISDFEGKLLAL